MERDRLSDEQWFALYGANVAGGAASVDPELVRAFSRVVAELEQVTGKVLGEPARSRCFAAYVENEDGFLRCVGEPGSAGRVRSPSWSR